MDLIDRNELIKKLTDRHSKHYVNWKAFKDYMGERKVIHHTEMDECKEIIDIIVKQPTIEAVPVVHLDTEKSEILDVLDKMQFFLGQRAGRELWNDKPEDIQEKDLENFNEDIQKIKEYLFNVKPVERGEWKEYSYNQFMGLDEYGEPKFRESIGYRCTKCELNSIIKHSFCPRCGRDMRKLV